MALKFDVYALFSMIMRIRVYLSFSFNKSELSLQCDEVLEAFTIENAPIFSVRS